MNKSGNDTAMKSSGAICTHWRVGELFVPQIVLGVLVWVGIYLREPRLRAILPIRTIRN